MKSDRMCGKLIKQIHDELEKQANSVLCAQNLTLAQMHVLMELHDACDHQLKLKQLEGVLHVAQSTAAGIVSRLEQKGYVKCFVDAGDRRVKWVSITDAGLGCCEEAREQIESMGADLLRNLTKSEQKQFCMLLQKICNER